MSTYDTVAVHVRFPRHELGVMFAKEFRGQEGRRAEH